MAQGTIKRLTVRGFGFIDAEAGQVLFFHRSAVEYPTFPELRHGDRVEFDIEPDPRGRGDEATHVRQVAEQAR